MINVTELKVAIRARLVGDATLAGLVGGVFSVTVPATVTWTLPVIEFGVQAEAADDAGYGVDASDVLVRLKALARGAAPGVGSFDTVYAVLARADTVLRQAPLVAAGQTVWMVRRAGGIPETSPPDDSGYLRFEAGNLYRVRSYV